MEYECLAFPYLDIFSNARRGHSLGALLSDIAADCETSLQVVHLAKKILVFNLQITFISPFYGASYRENTDRAVPSLRLLQDGLLLFTDIEWLVVGRDSIKGADQFRVREFLLGNCDQDRGNHPHGSSPAKNCI